MLDGYKCTFYAGHGVLEFWLVDSVPKTVCVDRPAEGALAVTNIFGRA